MERPCELCREGTLSGPVVRDYLICSTCGFCRKSTIPSKKKLLHGLRNFLLGACSTKEKEKHRLDEAHLRLAELEAHTAPGLLYDVGASSGFVMKAAMSRGWKVRGNDIGIKAVKWAKDKYGIDIFYGFLEDDDTEEGSFDAIIFWNTLEHLHDPVASTEKARRMLRPGGYVHIRVPNKNTEEVSKFYTNAHMTEFTEDTMDLLRRKVGLEKIFARESRQVSVRGPAIMDFLWRKPT